VVFRIQPRV
jgi:hypothetical protein